MIDEEIEEKVKVDWEKLTVDVSKLGYILENRPKRTINKF